MTIGANDITVLAACLTRTFELQYAVQSEANVEDDRVMSLEVAQAWMDAVTPHLEDAGRGEEILFYTLTCLRCNVAVANLQGGPEACRAARDCGL